MTAPNANDVRRLISQATPDPPMDQTKSPEQVEQAQAALAAIAHEHPDLVVEVLAGNPYGIAPFTDLALSLLDRIGEPARVTLHDALCDFVRRGSRPNAVASSLKILARLGEQFGGDEVRVALLETVTRDIRAGWALWSYYADALSAVDDGSAFEVLSAAILSQSEATTWRLRQQLAVMLGRLDNPQALEPLQTVLEWANAADENDMAAQNCREQIEGIMNSLRSLPPR
ncbi:MAG: hypothetical protein JW910_00310 [Anaerolineae bacterium]|nr:hypothetical protein [Anaerolineae bacterium]